MKKGNIYQHPKWKAFSKEVKKLKGEYCTVCERHESEVVMQLHHPYYKKGLMPWEYDIDELQLICSGCHAREHKILEPSRDWQLLAINHHTHLSTNCQRQKSDGSICNQVIMNTYEVFHPEVGHRIVGSTCVGHLTRESKAIVNDFNNVVKTCEGKILRVQGGEKVRGWKNTRKNGHRFKTKKSNGNYISVFFYHERAHIYKLIFSYTTAELSCWEQVRFVNDYNGNSGKALYAPLNKLIEFTFLFEQYLESKTNEKDHLKRYFAERINMVMAEMKWSFLKNKK